MPDSGILPAKNVLLPANLAFSNKNLEKEILCCMGLILFAMNIKILGVFKIEISS
jgi:hypothetical protein